MNVFIYFIVSLSAAIRTVCGCHVRIQQSDGSKKELTLLDPKRSNAINIGLTTLPPARTIRTAIFKMDSTIISREQIEVAYL